MQSIRPRRLASLTAIAAVTLTAAVWFAAPADAGTSVDLYCSAGMALGSSTASATKVQAQTQPLVPPCEYNEIGGYYWVSYVGHYLYLTPYWTFNYSTAGFSASNNGGHAEMQGQHNACDANYANCNGYVDTSAFYN